MNGVPFKLTYQRFKRGNTIAKRYKDATAAEKREMLAEVLSNSTLENRNIVSFQYKTPFAAMAKVPAKPSISQLLTSLNEVRTSIIESEYHFVPSWILKKDTLSV